jgi:hypothetical protein
MQTSNKTATSWTLNSQSGNLNWVSQNQNIQINFRSVGEFGNFTFAVTNGCGTLQNNYNFRSTASGTSPAYSISPNPAATQITVRSTSNTPDYRFKTMTASPDKITISIYDNIGTLRKVFSFIRNDSYQISVNDLIPGLYTVKIVDNGNVSIQKLIIQR